MDHVAALIPQNELQVLWRVILAALAGGVIGWNRQIAGRPAGLRTHMLVSLGAALFTLIPLQVTGAHAAEAMSRTLQGVATGVGFLGAGEIFREMRPRPGNPPVHGLTSAAAIWVAAAIGVVAGCGLWQLTIFGTAVTLIVLSGARRLEQHLPFLPKDHNNQG